MNEFFKGLNATLIAFVEGYHASVITPVVDSKRYEHEPDRFYYTVMHKTYATLDSSIPCIASFHNRQHLRIGLFIQLRAILSDVITTEYVTRCGQDDDNKKELIKAIYADHIYHLYDSAGTIFKEVLSATNADVLRLKEKIRNRKPEFFEGENFSISRAGISVKSAVRKMYSQRKAGDNMQFVEQAFNYYDRFSKLEHLGDLSFQLTHELYKPENLKRDYTELYLCLLVILSAMLTLPHHWNLDTSDIKGLSDAVVAFHPDKLPSS